MNMSAPESHLEVALFLLPWFPFGPVFHQLSECVTMTTHLENVAFVILPFPHVLGTVLKLYYWLTLNSAGIHCTSVVGSQNE